MVVVPPFQGLRSGMVLYSQGVALGFIICAFQAKAGVAVGWIMRAFQAKAGVALGFIIHAFQADGPSQTTSYGGRGRGRGLLLTSY